MDEMQELKGLEIPSDLDFDSEDIELLVEDAEFRQEIEKEFKIKFRDVPPEELQSHMNTQAEIDEEAAQFDPITDGDKGEDGDAEDDVSPGDQESDEDEDVEMGRSEEEEKDNMQKQPNRGAPKNSKKKNLQKRANGRGSKPVAEDGEGDDAKPQKKPKQSNKAGKKRKPAAGTDVPAKKNPTKRQKRK